MARRKLPYMQCSEGPSLEVEGGTRCVAHSRLQVPIFSKCTGEYMKIGTFLFFATIAAELQISKQNTSLLSLRRLEAGSIVSEKEARKVELFQLTQEDLGNLEEGQKACQEGNREA